MTKLEESVYQGVSEIFFSAKPFNSVDIDLIMHLVYGIRGRVLKNCQDAVESIFIDKNRCRLRDLLGLFDRALFWYLAFCVQQLGIKLCGAKNKTFFFIKRRLKTDT